MNQTYTDPETGARRCRCFKRCGGCQLDEPYAAQLERKQEKANRMLGTFCKVMPIIPAEKPCGYRSKVQNVFARDRRKQIVSGVYQSSGQKMVTVEDCMLEDERAAPIIRTLKKLMQSLRIAPYDLRTGQGLLRHTLIRISASTGQIMLVLVTASPILPAKKHLIDGLTKAHPELTTIVQNICPDGLPLTLGPRSVTLFGRGWIEDDLCGCRFRISPASFYQVNPAQTERLYRCAVEAAQIKKGETVIDAYCGTGTLGMICAAQGAEVTGVELNRSACRDAAENAKRNQLGNIRFCCADAGEFMQQAAREGGRCDVLLMDPPRAGADAKFLRAAAALKPARIVYVSCGIESLRRDLMQLVKSGYRVRRIQPVDMFPHTTGIETVCLLTYAGK